MKSNYTALVEFIGLAKIFSAFLLGAIIGYEREKIGKNVGIRTFALIAGGACAYTVISELLSPDTSARVIANIIVGIGFLSGGLFYNSQEGKFPSGLTTAASLWITAAIGVMVGVGFIVIALGMFILTIIFLHMPSSRLWKKFFKNMR